MAASWQQFSRAFGTRRHLHNLCSARSQTPRSAAPYISKVAPGTQNLTEPSQESRANRGLPLAPLALLGVSVLLVAVTVLGEMTRFADYVWLQRLLKNPVLFLVAAGAFVGLALAYGRRVGRVERVALTLIFGVVGWCLSLMLGWFATAEVERVEGDEFTVVVEEGVDLIDTYWLLYVEPSNPGLLDRSRYMGCVNGDWQHLKDVTWLDGRLLIRSSAGSVAVTIDGQGKRTSVERASERVSPGNRAQVLGACPRAPQAP